MLSHRIQLLIVLLSAPGALPLCAGTGPAKPLTHVPTGETSYDVLDMDRIVRTGPVVERNVYTTRKRYRRKVTALPEGRLRVDLMLLSSVMQLNGTTLPVDLGGRTSSDLIRPTGEPVQLGLLEDPARSPYPFPRETPAIGRLIPVTVPPPASAGRPGTISVDFKLLGPTKTPDGEVVRARWVATQHGDSVPSGLRLDWKQTMVVDLDPGSLELVTLDSRTRHIEIWTTPDGQQTVTRNQHRTVRRLPAADPR